MGTQRYANNISLVTTADIGLWDTTIPINDGTVFGPSGLVAGDWMYLTLFDPAWTDHYGEIVKMTAFSPTDITVERNISGDHIAWPSGTKVEARLTAEMMRLLAVNTNTVSGVAIGDGADDLTGLDFRPTAAYDVGNLMVSDGLLFFAATGGTSGSSFTYVDGVGDGQFFSYDLYWQSGDIKFIIATNPSYAWADRLTIGNRAHAGNYGTAIGTDTLAAEGSSTAVGRLAVAGKDAAVALGTQTSAFNYATALGSYSRAVPSATAVGCGASAAAYASVSIRAASWRDFQFTIGAVPCIPRDCYGQSNGFQNNCNIETTWAGAYVELGSVATWQAETAYTDGAAVQPPTPDGFQYAMIVSKFDPEVTTNQATSGAAEPAWSAEANVSFAANDGGNDEWMCHDPLTGLDEALPANMLFFPTEVGFICFNYASVSAKPYVSIGTAASPTLLVNNQQLSSITAANMRHRFTSMPDVAITDLRCKLITAATGAGAKFHGRFYAKGMFIQTQG